jgi:hypothetical protein
VSTQDFDLDEYRRERAARLERENDHLRAERDRLLQLLAEALRVAVAGTTVTPTALLDVLGDVIGTNLGVGAFVEQRERREARWLLERTIQLLRETA